MSRFWPNAGPQDEPQAADTVPPKGKPLDDPVTQPAAPKTPRFSREGVLLNPEECEIGSDGVIRGRA